MSDNRCVEPLDFPKLIHNRPGLSRIEYRIGTYSDFRAAMLRALDENPTLSAWTHREPDDPGIALLEGAAVLGDILTLYQNVYANEAHLRTAAWRESVSELVRLLGYRLSPGVGGRATFAFEVRGDDPIQVPAGFPVKAELDPNGKAEFETEGALTAYPALGSFSLHRKARFASIANGSSSFSVDTEALEEHIGSLEAGDRLFLVKTPTSTTTARQVVVVEAVEQRFDRTHITIAGSWQQGSASLLTAYKLGRSFRHFGYNAPATVVTIVDDVTNTDAVADVFDFQSEVEIPLAAEVDDLSAGATMLVRVQLRTSATANDPAARFFVREIVATANGTETFGAITGGSTIVELDADITVSGRRHASVRDVELFEVIGGPVSLEGARVADPAGDLGTLYFFGAAERYTRLDERRLLFSRDDGTTEIVTATFDAAQSTYDGERLRPVYLTAFEEPFSIADFPLFEAPRVTVYGNLADATQGKTEKETVLGNGDNRQQFQTFKVPKAPLTYLNSIGETPPEVPEITVYVDEREWQRVPTFFGRGADEEIYVVREDLNGDSWVQFGDGETGRRLPSGVKNVKVIQRSGVGAYGPLAEGAKPSAGDRLDRLDAIRMPIEVSGGDERESADNARVAAPGRVQSLGRLVGLTDFESEALAIPGVSKARAVWGLVENVPSVEVTLLMDTGRAAEFSAAGHILTEYNRCRGPDRFPVEVVQGQRHYVYATLEIGYDATYRPELLEEAIGAALGAVGVDGEAPGATGLFAMRDRRFGEREFVSRVIGAAQNVPGVVWVQANGFDELGTSDDPDTLVVPSSVIVNPGLGSNPHGIYALRSTHLSVSFHIVTTEEVC